MASLTVREKRLIAALVEGASSIASAGRAAGYADRKGSWRAFNRLPAKIRAAEISLPSTEQIAETLGACLCATRSVRASDGGTLVVPNYAVRLRTAVFVATLRGLVPERSTAQAGEPSERPSWREGCLALGHSPEVLDRLEAALERLPTKDHAPGS